MTSPSNNSLPAPAAFPCRWWALLLGLTAAAITAICAAHAGEAAATTAWRAAVSLLSVWAFQWSIAEVWKIAGDEPAPARAVCPPAKGYSSPRR
jgi:hypothetical protein